ncbi:MAG: ATP-binding protein [Deltaproteobacteria bacterium]|nr:ATP-binding protein [Deltaproteobacteria bacterium]
MSLTTILIIDPDRDFARTTERFLLSHGYKVSLAHNGNQAIKKLSSETPLLVFLSLKSQDMEGEELLKRIHEIAPQLSIILTDFGNEAIADLMKYGVVDFFPKPIENTTLLQAVKKVPILINPMFNDPGKEGIALLAQFFPFLVHELRNPLQAIGGALTIIEKRSSLEDKPLAQSLNIIKEEVQHLSGFVQKCLDFVRPLNRDFCIEVDLNDLVLLCIKMITYMFQETTGDIKIITDFDPDLPKVYVNYEEIKQVLLNCMKNGVEAMNQSSLKELTIKTTKKVLNNTGWVEIIISDTGLGIKNENLELIGTPFFTTKIRGTGLGLAICHRIIVDRHKGKILIESEEAKGTTVTIKLPVNPKREAQEEGKGQ